jgi:precorrin-6B methylase 1
MKNVALMNGWPVLSCERLTLPDQSLTWTTLGKLCEQELHWLSVIAVQAVGTVRPLGGGHHADTLVTS